MTNSSQIIDAVEKYTKGKKSVRKTKEGKESFDLAMKALAFASKNGDDVARARAQNLVDRINQVRGVKKGQRNFVDLKAYAPANPERQKTQQKTIQKNGAQIAPK